MVKYHAVIQSIVRLDEKSYRLTFRVHGVGTEDKQEDGREAISDSGVDRAVYTSEIKLGDEGFVAFPEPDLDECIRVYSYQSGEYLQDEGLRRKWIIGNIADQIFDGLSESKTLRERKTAELA